MFFLNLLPDNNLWIFISDFTMTSLDLAELSVRELCELFRSGGLPEHMKDMTLSEIARCVSGSQGVGGHVESVQSSGQLDIGSAAYVTNLIDQPAAFPGAAGLHGQLAPGHVPEATDCHRQPEGVELAADIDGQPAGVPGGADPHVGDQDKTFQWREKLPNSNNTNPPILLWRGDENCSSTVALAFGIYDEEFIDLKEEVMEVTVKNCEGLNQKVKFQVELDFPKDEKLSRKHAGLAGSGSDYLCTYCSQSRKSAKDPPHSGCNPVTLSNTLLREAAHYCQFNPSQKSQEQLSKIALGVKEVPLSTTELYDERPDALHLGAVMQLIM